MGTSAMYHSTGDNFPTKKELKFLQLRQQLKNRIRKNHLKELGPIRDCSVVDKNRLRCDNFGSFFGPSQHSIAKRVMEESKSLMPELKHLASTVRNSRAKGEKSLKSPALITSTTKYGLTELKLKCKNLKQSRDYSFLFSDNAAILTTSKGEPELGKDPAPKSSDERNPGSTKDLKSVQTEEKSSLKHKVPPAHGTSSLGSLCATRKQLVQKKECQPKKIKRHVKDDSYEDHNVDVSSIIKEIFGRNRKHYRDDYDDDDGAMVSTFDDILKEERKSAKVARKEDEIERLRIEQEEKQERLRKAKKQKLIRASKN